jgi:DnaJ-class molecular chaperone
MKIQSGWRYGATVLGEGSFEGVLEGPAGADVWREGGGGEVVMKRWLLRLDDGATINVQEVELTVIEARGLGAQAGPVACGACQGSGAREKPRAMTSAICGNCGGDGIAYPD